ncbi:hypothetical protein LIER_15882 [Lithospermum erythrorhizon]|uniref:Uncharacterized protein n=1 Tax=Lithospermum erythrorhizon TaxID=34254 RepID=A0AAV3Q4H6_LITER
MMKAYQCIKPDSLTYCYPDLLNAVQIHQDSVFVPDPQDIRITAHLDYHEIIRSLKYMVEAAVQKELPPSPPYMSDVVDRFITISNKALNCFDIDKLGYCNNCVF